MFSNIFASEKLVLEILFLELQKLTGDFPPVLGLPEPNVLASDWLNMALGSSPNFGSGFGPENVLL